MVGDPRAAERLCDDEDDSDAVSICVFVRDEPQCLNAGLTSSSFCPIRHLVILAAVKATGN